MNKLKFYLKSFQKPMSVLVTHVTAGLPVKIRSMPTSVNVQQVTKEPGVMKVCILEKYEP